MRNTKIDINAVFKLLDHELRRSKRNKQRSKAYNRIHKRNYIKSLKKSLEPEGDRTILINITNYYYEINGQKNWFVSLQEALDNLYYNHKELYLSTLHPLDLIKAVYKEIELLPINA